MDGNTKNKKVSDECVIPERPIPAQYFANYNVERDIHSEKDIANYIESEARDETVQHVERIKQEVVLGDKYEVWDVITDNNRWWVITNLTNLYSQEIFTSLDYTLSFHIGLMMRIRSRTDHISSKEPTPFDEVFRRMEQAEYRHDSGVEVEDYQAVGMLLRECLLSLIPALRRRTVISQDEKHPQEANFVEWSNVLANHLCSGSSNKALRQHLKTLAKEAWQLVSWLIHTKSANSTASSIAIHSCQTIVGHFIQVLERDRTDKTDYCPVCKSRDLRSHFDITIPPDGDYYLSCGICNWNNYPADAVDDR